MNPRELNTEDFVSYVDGYSDANSGRERQSSDPVYLAGYEDGLTETFESEF